MTGQTKTRCPYCSRPMAREDAARAANPFCQACLDERVERAAAAMLPVARKRIGNVIVLIPNPGIFDEGSEPPASGSALPPMSVSHAPASRRRGSA